MSAPATRSKEEQEEREHFLKVLNAFKAYKRDSKLRLGKSWHSLSRLPKAQQDLLEREGFQDSLKRLEECVDANAAVVAELIQDVGSMFENVRPEDREDEDVVGDGDGPRLPRTRPDDVDKVQSTIKQFVRDWSREGAAERNMCYKPVLDKLLSLYGGAGVDRSQVKVLVPGAGMGRLAFDIAREGFECQGNEFSLFMLVASNFVLNRCAGAVDSRTVHPWIHQFTNVSSTDDRTRAVTFPDVDPGSLPEDAHFSMAAGDFLEVYAEPEYRSSQDCVVTCFFIDCAHNIVDFVELIHRVLKPGGHWINFGPLLYHFSESPQEPSIEPSYEVVRGVVEKTGFEFVSEETGVRATYAQNPGSMLEYWHKCVFFTCKKKVQ